MKKITLCLLLTMVGYIALYTQIYHEQDKEGLRISLRQGTNFEKAGLIIADIATWNTSKEWIEKVKRLTWTNDSPNKQIVKIDWNYNYNYKLERTLNASYSSKLSKLDCSGNRLSKFNISKNTELTWLDSSINKLINLDISQNTELSYIYCSSNYLLTSLNVSKETKLYQLYCGYNQLLPSALPLTSFVIPEPISFYYDYSPQKNNSGRKC